MDGTDISKMKVADLKKELKLRGLSTNGTKNELVERLQEAANIAEDPDGGDNSTLDDDLLDEDAVLADESEEGILGEGGDNGAVNDDDAALLTPTATSAPSAQKDQTVTTSKKVVLNRKTAVVVPTVTASVPPTAEEATAKDSTNENSDGELNKDKKVVKLTEMTAQERAKLHAQKFGLPVSEAAKKLARAERFGLNSAANNSNSSKPTKNSKEVDEKILKRQARFGVVAPSAAASEVEAKKQKRAERFGVATPAAAKGELDEQKRKRAERFGLAA